jgi:CspA family cold shock protein
MAQGKIKKLVAEKGFGFIEMSGQQDIFFHHSVVAEQSFDELQPGQRVTFEMDEAGGSKGKGPRAKSVTPL